MEKLKFRRIGKNKIEIFIPEVNKWVLSFKVYLELKKLGLSTKEWFDNHFLPKDENGNIIPHKCEYSKCNNETKFVGILFGYRKTCCSSHHMKRVAEDPNSYCHSKENKIIKSEEMKRRMSDEDSSIKISLKSDECLAKRSITAIDRLNDPNSSFGSHKLTKISFLSSKMNKVFTLKSSFEMRYAEFLDSNDEIESFEYENFIKGGIPYEYQGRKRKYYPDFKVTSIYDTITIVEVKPEYLVNNEEVQAKMKALNKYIKENNLEWNTAWITEVDLKALSTGRYFHKTLSGEINYID